LSHSVDLSQYTTTNAARDINNVRGALFYDHINIVAYSYGTRLAQEYLRHYDQSVRATLLIGPLAPALYVPAGMSTAAEFSLDAILDRCEADAECSAAYPDIYRDLKKLKILLNQGGLVLHKGSNGQSEDVQISAGVVASYLRTYLYSATRAVALPRLIHTLIDERANQRELAAIIDWREEFTNWAPSGMYMAITCTEDVPFVDEEKERVIAVGTLLGSYRIDQQFAACKVWPHAKVAEKFHTPVVSSVPTLLLVGQFDPATPASYSGEIASHLPNGKLIIVPNRGHAMPEGWDECLGKVSIDFFENADANKIDADCAYRLSLPKFDIPRS
jgi:pimeloyl-ACP methyl ester carboxylesterase